MRGKKILGCWTSFTGGLFKEFARIFALLLLQAFIKSYLDGKQHGQELFPVTDQHGVADERHGLFDGVLDGNRRDVLSSRCDDQLWEHTQGENLKRWHSWAAESIVESRVNNLVKALANFCLGAICS